MNSRKDLVNAYKRQKFPAGVFQIRNTVNNKVYVDGSVNLDKIWNRHASELKLGGHRNEALQRDWNQYGAEKFVFEILSEIRQEDGDAADYTNEVKKLTAMFIGELQPFGEKGYNNIPK